MKRGMDSVSCLRVGKLKAEYLLGGDAMAGCRQGDAGGSEIAQILPRQLD
jgi:hypothetical protein